MARTKVEAESEPIEPSLDENLEAVCSTLALDENKCFLMKGMVTEIVGDAKECKLAKKKRVPSLFNLFIGSCIKEKTGPVPERFRSCVVEWKEKKKS